MFVHNCASRAAPQISRPIQDKLATVFDDEAEAYEGEWKRLWRILCTICTASLWVQRNRVVHQGGQVSALRRQHPSFSAHLRDQRPREQMAGAHGNAAGTEAKDYFGGEDRVLAHYSSVLLKVAAQTLSVARTAKVLCIGAVDPIAQGVDSEVGGARAHEVRVAPLPEIADQVVPAPSKAANQVTASALTTLASAAVDKATTPSPPQRRAAENHAPG
ncbi:hypothetical protein ON010_g18071 [Phytophthora cinnamomi]|nr:hypothetical protein ON010_g18071 [Phytophthora cinnamomi]